MYFYNKTLISIKNINFFKDIYINKVLKKIAFFVFYNDFL